MASSGFQFKQFYIGHDKCAMKVGTDSILLGSWADVSDARRMLDIGTGSGLLAIMLAQKSARFESVSEIIAIEPEFGAFTQASENIELCPWNNCIDLYQTRLQTYLKNKIEKNDNVGFDVIISNPPYFESQSAKVADVNAQRFTQERRQARHQGTLNLQELASHVQRLLNPSGKFYCILPSDSEALFESAINEQRLFIEQKLVIHPRSDKPVKRIAWKVSKSEELMSTHRLVIYNEEQKYTEQYRSLCRDFYLNF